MLKSLDKQTKLADEKAAEMVKDDEVVKRLTTVPASDSHFGGTGAFEEAVPQSITAGSS